MNIYSLSDVTLDVATTSYYQGAEPAHSVEQCRCPINYQGEVLYNPLMTLKLHVISSTLVHTNCDLPSFRLELLDVYCV